MNKVAMAFICILGVSLTSCRYELISGEDHIVLKEYKKESGCAANYIKPGIYEPRDCYYLETINHFIITPVKTSTFKSVSVSYCDPNGANHYVPEIFYYIDDSLKYLYVDINDDFGDRQHYWHVGLKVNNKTFSFKIEEKSVI